MDNQIFEFLKLENVKQIVKEVHDGESDYHNHVKEAVAKCIIERAAKGHTRADDIFEGADVADALKERIVEALEKKGFVIQRDYSNDVYNVSWSEA